MSYTFDWHQLSEDDFLKWAIPHLLVGVDAEKLDQIRRASKDHTEVVLTIQINGIGVPTQEFVKGIDENMVRYAVDAATEMLDEISELHSLKETIEQLEHEVTERVTVLARANDVPWKSRDDR